MESELSCDSRRSLSKAAGGGGGGRDGNIVPLVLLVKATGEPSCEGGDCFSLLCWVKGGGGGGGGGGREGKTVLLVLTKAMGSSSVIPFCVCEETNSSQVRTSTLLPDVSEISAVWLGGAAIDVISLGEVR